MAKHRRTHGLESVRPDPERRPAGHRRAAAEPAGEAYWSVARAGWSSIRPGLPGHVADLLAPPIVVGVARVPVAVGSGPSATVGSGPSATVGPGLAPATVGPAPVRAARGTASASERAAPGVNWGPFLDSRR